MRDLDPLLLVLALSFGLLACAAPAVDEPPALEESVSTAEPVADEPAGSQEPLEEPVGELADEPDPDPWAEAGYRSAPTSLGTYVVRWRPVGGEVPRNEHFELEVLLCENPDSTGEPGEPVPINDAILVVSGWMPDHGHGMIRQPRATPDGDGRYRVKGMLFHMPGHWQLFFDPIVDGVSERAEFELDL